MHTIDALDVQLDVMQSRVAELEAELSVRRAQTPDAVRGIMLLVPLPY